MFITRQIYHGEFKWLAIALLYETKPKLSVDNFSLEIWSLLGARREGDFLMMLHFLPWQTLTSLTEHNTAVLYSKSEHMAFFQFNLFLAALIS